MALGSAVKVRSRVARLTRFSAPTSISRSSNPAAGTRRFSNPRAVPTNNTWAAKRSRSSRAMASAGITCPPVPPPATNARMDVEEYARERPGGDWGSRRDVGASTTDDIQKFVIE